MADRGLDMPSKKIVLDVGRVSFYLKIAILGLIIVPLGVGALGSLCIIITIMLCYLNLGSIKAKK